MDRQKIVLVLLTAALLVALGVWTYSSGSTGSFADTGRTTGTSKAGSGSGGGSNGNGGSSGSGGGGGSGTTSPKSATTVALGPTTTVEQNPEAYANALYDDWTRRDVGAAHHIATDAVVTKLFQTLWHKSGNWMAKGCVPTTATTTCTWIRKHRSLAIQVRNATANQSLLVTSTQLTVTH